MLLQAICWEGGVSEQSFSSHVSQPDSRFSLLFPFLSWRRLLRMDQNPFGCLVPDIRLSLCLYFPCAKPFMPISGYKMKLPAVIGRSFCLQVLLFCCFTAHVHTGLHRINLLFRYLIKVSVPSSSESKVISD